MGLAPGSNTADAARPLCWVAQAEQVLGSGEPPGGCMPFVFSVRQATCALLASATVLLAGAARAEPIGAVDTAFKLIGPDHKVVVDAHDDPGVAGITCYVSRAKTGGITGAIGVAEDKAEASIACRQVGTIGFAKPLKAQEEIFSERISLLFKKLRVVRMVDAKRNVLVYLTYSDRLIDGSPKNSVSVVPVDRATPIPLR